jgi:RNA polymerase sigma factor (sigma-70 family)
MTKEKLLPLLQLAVEKNQKAQTQLINYYWNDVFSFSLQKLGDYRVADEITVAVFAKVLSKLNLYDPAFQFKKWILTVTQNTIIDYWRKKARENEDATDGLEMVENQFAKSPEELMISNEEQKKILKIIETLDANYQTIIQLRFFEEKSIKEISEELQISVSSTKIRIMRAKKLLAKLLQNEDFSEL